VDAATLPDISDEHPELEEEEERLYASHMKAREDAFERIFGLTDPPGQVFSPSDAELTVNWPGGGLHRYAPKGAERPGWHWVTHGLSQPMDEEVPGEVSDPDAWSGLGLEYALSTPSDGEWPAHVLLNMVRYQLLSEDAPLFTVGHHINCGLEGLTGAPSRIEHILGTFAPHHPSEVRLPAGRCTLVHLVGITSAERERIRSVEGPVQGAAALTLVLRQLGVGVLTDPARGCVTEHEDFARLFKEALETLHALPE
jgi:hypothetical protein